MTEVRPWQPGDDLDGLLGAGADPLWVAQGHALHGEDRDGDRWRRTLVAVEDGEPVGAVTVARNRVHPGRWIVSIEVAPARRRRGLGTLLLDLARELRPDDRPLSAKVRPHRAGGAFARAAGARTYQHCECAQVRPEARASTALTLTERPVPDLGALLSAQYRWVHAAWSPLDEGMAGWLGGALAADVLSDLSAVSWAGGRPAALAVAFPGAPHLALLAETVDEHQLDGDRHLEAAVHRALTACAQAGVELVEFDGHVTDPHLHPLLQRLPRAGEDPLHLVEVS
ncbi:GNAT family N-acetyltransferase [Klenkia brasiliensis]|uniref:Acetyltransferase (GNAT) family protein n=1 Tax=Klenkia brasiliensis TaxID=333142 RepID=A0A1G7T948_9ACTN|nr:GNAT family N-acetyltransferase [Klenkia brasiliensis]SDG31826.1 Acetyltransferase (GNAT) family protein [Klenkia brasiliensis]